MKTKEYYEYGKEKDRCTYGLYLKSCRQCLFETLCRLERGKDDTIEAEQTI